MRNLFAMTLVAVLFLLLAQADARADDSTIGTVGPGGTRVYTVTANPGAIASIVVIGNGNTDLDLFVYDACGRLLGSDTDASDNCLVIVRVPCNGRLQVEIENLGSCCNRFALIVR